jgi:hypothetical protein
MTLTRFFSSRCTTVNWLQARPNRFAAPATDPVEPLALTSAGRVIRLTFLSVLSAAGSAVALSTRDYANCPANAVYPPIQDIQRVSAAAGIVGYLRIL